MTEPPKDNGPINSDLSAFLRAHEISVLAKKDVELEKLKFAQFEAQEETKRIDIELAHEDKAANRRHRLTLIGLGLFAAVLIFAGYLVMQGNQMGSYILTGTLTYVAGLLSAKPFKNYMSSDNFDEDSD
ncbi:hypothetical protein [Leptospira andrefontaineae]|uniref:DUF2335 domain-containing protein n=1 Tax=Leptospira andrefontaineae TaxID=2484976 RepID=A0A4R9H6L1_9LEPT|nr:hypothetical protein [Leptospira andrefontaineae]TGK41208.1 hypothetical protein EHO65_07185 [Leptospira andrefontaineae]